jgi:hypothetical protein
MSSTASGAISRQALVGMVMAVLKRPDLWSSAFGALCRMAAPGWWRSAPYLPLPAGGLWAFRMLTAYGDADAAPAPADLLSYLQWCRTTSGSRGSRAAMKPVIPGSYRDVAR